MVNHWFGVPDNSIDHRASVIAFPFAGGSAAVFRGWRLRHGVGLVPALLPGREKRLSESPHKRILSIVADVADHLPTSAGLPLVLFGHSMGALIAYELALELTRRGDAPAGLIVSGASAAHLAPTRDPIHQLSDADFAAALRSLGGTPAAVFEHRELLDLLLPMLRADFEAVETYDYSSSNELVACPVAAYAGADDDLATPSAVAAWRDVCAGSCTMTTFTGGHFFITDCAPEVAAQLSSDTLGFLSSRTSDA